jgi:hypothetical protein
VLRKKLIMPDNRERHRYDCLQEAPQESNWLRGIQVVNGP